MWRKKLTCISFYVCILSFVYVSAHAQKINYSAYSSLIKAYTEQFGTLISIKTSDSTPMYHTWGLIYTDLKDLNGDGIKELILVRVHKNKVKAWGNTHLYGLNTAARKTLQIFTLHEDGTPVHVGSMDPLLTANDLPGWYSIDYVTRGDTTYIINGHEGNTLSKDIWQMQGTKMQPAISFEGPWDDGEAPMYNLNSALVSEAQYNTAHKKWLSKTQSIGLHNFSGKDLKTLKAINAKTQKFLKAYPPIQGSFPAATFHKNRFIIFETDAQSPQEKIVKEYLMALAAQDYTAFSRLMPTIPQFNMQKHDLNNHVSRNVLDKYEEHKGYEMTSYTMSFLKNRKAIKHEGRTVKHFGDIVEEFFTFDESNLDFIKRSPKTAISSTADNEFSQDCITHLTDSLDKASIARLKYNYDLEEVKFVFVVQRRLPEEYTPSGIQRQWFLVGKEIGQDGWKIYNVIY